MPKPGAWVYVTVTMFRPGFRAACTTFVFLASCADPGHAKGSGTPAETATAAPSAPPSAIDASGHGAEPETNLDAGVDAAAPSQLVLPAAELDGKVVLHAGDSMVGGLAGLTRALGATMKEHGLKAYRTDSWVSANLSMFHQQKRFGELLQKNKPDVVILTLGANDVFSPAPDKLAPHVRAIVAKIGERPCLWVSPPAFPAPAHIKDGPERIARFVAMLKDNAAPCKFFDSTQVDMARARDRIHPTDAGGASWAASVWKAGFDPAAAVAKQ